MPGMPQQQKHFIIASKQVQISDLSIHLLPHDPDVCRNAIYFFPGKSEQPQVAVEKLPYEDTKTYYADPRVAVVVDHNMCTGAFQNGRPRPPSPPVIRFRGTARSEPVRSAVGLLVLKGERKEDQAFEGGVALQLLRRWAVLTARAVSGYLCRGRWSPDHTAKLPSCGASIGDMIPL